MRNLSYGLVTALLTFGISVTIASVWTNYRSVDRRLANALHRAYPEITEEMCKKQSLSAERCKNFQTRFSEQMAERVATDISNLEMGCRIDSLSEIECSRRKEEAIRDIQENFTSKADLK